MHADIVQIRRVWLRNVETVTFRVANQAEVLLFVSDEVLRRRHNPLRLNTLDALSEHNTSQRWVRSKTFPVSATLWRATEGACDGSKLHVDALAFVLGSHGNTAGVSHVTVEGSTDIDASWENGVEVGEPNANRAILQTERAESETRNAAGLPNAGFELPSVKCELVMLNTRLAMSTHPVPVVKLTFSSRVSWLTKAFAFSYALAHSPSPSPHGEGYFGGLV